MANRINLKAWLIISIFLIGSASTIAQATVIYVDANATGANDGSSWEDAYNYLQDALYDPILYGGPADIWVAEGIYCPDSDSNEPNGTGKHINKINFLEVQADVD